jgi:MULE transposase domain
MTGLPVTKRDVLNIQASMRIHQLDELSSTQTLLTRLRDHSDYRYHLHIDNDGSLARLLVFERGSLEILRSNPEVLLVDSTYKTSRFDMPLFNIIGVTAMNTSFFVGFGFLDAEDGGSFKWALERLRDLYDELGIRHPTAIISDHDTTFLEALKIVFPQSNYLLCIRYVFKNILAHCKMEFKKDITVKNPNLSAEGVRTKVAEIWEGLLPDINYVFYAKTAEEYKTSWYAFEAKWVPRYPWIPKYIEDTWLRKYSMLVVTAWTDHIPHFGNTAIPRAGHAVIKDAIRSSGGDLDKVLYHISAILRRQLEEYRGELARQTASPPRNLLNPIYQLILKHISYHALLKTDEIVQHLRGLQEEHQEKHKDNAPFTLDPCARSCSNSMGIPCIHRICERLTYGVALLLEDFHEHWSLERSADCTPLNPHLFVKEPQECMTKMRTGKRKRQSQEGDSTIREPAVEVQGRGKALDNDLNVAVQPIRKRRNEGTMAPRGNLEYSGYTPGGKIIRF